MVKYRTSMTEKRFKEILDFVAQNVRYSAEFIEIVGQSVFSGKTIVFREEEMKEVTVDVINRALTDAAEADAAKVEESPLTIPFEELPEQPEWDEERLSGPPPSEEEEDNGGEF